MIIYNPESMIKERIEEAKSILAALPYKYCFITGSFLYCKKFKDIDLFIITRSKKKPKLNKKIKATIIDFNDLHSLFYHSISKMCVAKNILPKKPLRTTIADYWNIINETIPTLLNEKTNFHKSIRSLILSTEYLKNNNILDSPNLKAKINTFTNYKQVLKYIKEESPKAIINHANKNYIKRYFYTQAAFHKQNISYKGQKDLYDISHAIVQGA